jgi:hypothetical protein
MIKKLIGFVKALFTRRTQTRHELRGVEVYPGRYHLQGFRLPNGSHYVPANGKR